MFDDTHRIDPVPAARRDASARKGGGRRRPGKGSAAVYAARTVTSLAAVMVLVGTGMGWRVYRTATSGIVQSHALEAVPTSVGKDMNVLVMGLDSRLDEKGNALPKQIYNQLHAGDGTVGGYNSNVLILVHIPGDGSKATAISIPRDDYVDLIGCPSTPCKGKIKEAYGRAYAVQKQKLTDEGMKSSDQLEQGAREAGRKAEIKTVSQFLGGVPIDHFVEVTLVAFYEIAQVVSPIEVCVNENTSDSYSGARFHKGVQWISGRQAVAFVRQRRDPNEDLNFTDLDRDRRQQAFLISLSKKLQDTGTLTDMSKLQGLLSVAQANIAVDPGFLDLGKLAKTATRLTGGNITFFTLPVKDFGHTSEGEDVNLVDLPTIRAIVRKILGDPKDTGSSTTEGVPQNISGSSGTTLNVVNASQKTGIAAKMESALTAHGFSRGKATNGYARSESVIEYGSGASDAATQLGTILGISSPTADSSMADNTVRLTLGTDFTPPPGLLPADAEDSDDDTSSTPPTVPTAVSATGVGVKAPAPTDLSSLKAPGASAGVPCVK